MRSIGELMKDMGFNKDAPIDTQKAFIRHLIKAANNNSNARTIATPIAEANAAVPPDEAQLSFDPNILGVHTKKSVAR